MTGIGEIGVKRIRILLADDHEMIRSGLRALIEAQPDLEVVGEAEDGRDALERIAATAPDVLVLDVSMPELNGLRVMERIAAAGGGPRVLVLTAFAEGAYLRQMMAAGAAGYVLKRSAARALIAAIRSVASGGSYLDPALASLVVTGHAGPAPERGVAEGGELTPREREVMRAMTRGYTNKEIAERLSLSVKTVEAHRARLMAKLGLRSRAEVVQYALRVGAFSDEEP